MKQTIRRITVMALVAVACFLMVSPDVNAAAQISFGVSGDSMKLGDAAKKNLNWIPTYGPGNNIIIDGSEINVVWGSKEDWSIPAEIRHVKSLDNGQTWERSELIARGDHVATLGVSLAIGNYLDVKQYHYAFGADWGDAIYYANYSDKTPIDVSGGLGGDSYSRSIAADKQGNIYVCFYSSGIRCSRLITNSTGVTLDPSETALPVSTGYTSQEPAIAVDSTGTLYGTWSDGSGMVLGKRVSAGVWNSIAITAPGEEYWESAIDIADVDGEKKICVTWWGNSGIVVRCTTDEGNTWDILPNPPGSSSGCDKRPSIAIAANGDVNIAWDKPGDVAKDITFARYTNNKWDVVTVDTQYGAFDVKMDLDANGMAHLVYPGKNWSTLQYTRQTQ